MGTGEEGHTHHHWQGGETWSKCNDQRWRPQGRGRMRKWCPPQPPSPARVPPGFSSPSCRRFKINKFISLIHSLGVSQPAAFALGPRASESVYTPFTSGICISYGPVDLLDLSPLSFQSQIFWGLIFPVQVPRTEGGRCGTQIPHSLVRSSMLVRPS